MRIKLRDKDNRVLVVDTDEVGYDESNEEVNVRINGTRIVKVKCEKEKAEDILDRLLHNGYASALG